MTSPWNAPSEDYSRNHFGETDTVAQRMFDPGAGTGIASFLGGPFCGFIVLALNYRWMGRVSTAAQCVVGGAVGTVALMGVLALLPFRIPGSGIALAVGMAMLGKSLQSEDYNSHIARGGAHVSNWLAALVGLVGMVVLLGLFFVVLMMVGLDGLEEML